MVRVIRDLISLVFVLYINKCVKPGLIIYYSDEFEFTFVEGILKKHDQLNFKVVVIKRWVTSSNKDNLLYDFKLSEKVLSKLTSKVFISPQKRSITNSQWLVHIPHSLVSLHAIYKVNTFDKFNCLFSAGPHHDREFLELGEFNSIDKRKIFKVGYTRLEYLYNSFESHKLSNGDSDNHLKQLLLAPTFTNNSFFIKNGKRIISSLIDSGYKVIYRPHRYKMSSDFADYLEILKNEFPDKNRFELELTSDKADSLYTADLLITDYSGIAFEYALLREKPVLFLDLEKKIGNPDWDKFKNKPIEIYLRNDIGIVTQPTIKDILSNVDKLFKETEIYSAEIRNLKKSIVYNYPHSSGEAIESLNELLKKS